MTRLSALRIASVYVVFATAAYAATDYIAPGSPATVGQGGSVLGTQPDHPVPAPHGALNTLGLPGKQAQPDTKGPRLGRDDVVKRLQEAGYYSVVDLSEDGSGVWRATARKAGQTVKVRCDGTGAITER